MLAPTEKMELEDSREFERGENVELDNFPSEPVLSNLMLRQSPADADVNVPATADERALAAADERVSAEAEERVLAAEDAPAELSFVVVLPKLTAPISPLLNLELLLGMEESTVGCPELLSPGMLDQTEGMELVDVYWREFE